MSYEAGGLDEGDFLGRAPESLTVANPSRSAQISFAPAQRQVVRFPIPELVGTCRRKFRDRGLGNFIGQLWTRE
jgi:hypothetical protein